MISRYLRPEMESVWRETRRLELWLEIELLAVEGWELAEVAPKGVAERLRKSAKVDIKRAKEIEVVTRHDVAAFVQMIEEQVGKEDGRWVHLGMTSSDVLDTGFGLQLAQAADILLDGLATLNAAIKKRAFEHRHTVMVGRSHGIHAEPTTFGHKLAIWYDEIKRQITRLERAKDTISVGKISGPVGSFSNITPDIEAYVCKRLGIGVASASNQVIQRDRHAEFFSTLALIASSLEKFAIEVRHLQRTEVLEAEEKFHVGQKGSSAMPHKRNPVLSENVSGLARVIRSMALPAMENIPLWHERDISHSSVERIIAPDSTTLLDFAIHRMVNVVSNLVVYPETMKKNLGLTKGLVFSQSILVALIRAGWSRDEAYGVVQKVSMRCWETPDARFEDEVIADPEICGALDKETLHACFDLEQNLKFIDRVFERVFTEETDGA